MKLYDYRSVRFSDILQIRIRYRIHYNYTSVLSWSESVTLYYIIIRVSSYFIFFFTFRYIFLLLYDVLKWEKCACDRFENKFASRLGRLADRPITETIYVY